jgi:hypothetical protein
LSPKTTGIGWVFHFQNNLQIHGLVFFEKFSESKGRAGGRAGFHEKPGKEPAVLQKVILLILFFLN